MSEHTPADPDYWRARWAEGRTGWHRDEVNPAIVEHADVWLGDGPQRVFFPLCGKSVDMAYLGGRGHEVVGAEASEPAVRAFFAQELEREPAADRVDSFLRLASGPIEIYVGDFFELRRRHLGPVSAVFDRGSYIALPDTVRERYAQHMANLLAPGCRVLMSSVAYDDSKMEGPPFSVTHAEIAARFGDAFAIEHLSVDPRGSAPGRFAEAGITTTQDTVSLLVRR